MWGGSHTLNGVGICEDGISPGNIADEFFVKSNLQDEIRKSNKVKEEMATLPPLTPEEGTFHTRTQKLEEEGRPIYIRACEAELKKIEKETEKARREEEKAQKAAEKAAERESKKRERERLSQEKKAEMEARKRARVQRQTQAPTRTESSAAGAPLSENIVVGTAPESLPSACATVPASTVAVGIALGDITNTV
ncbi:hypothetical protein CYMTET_16479 [Cymbomonas tetramitiformis]|uniref:Uncharacterized protein n=1 Tax=Cymbomonas tetramitiformis TaxID=36881 RepID=A0AAE0L881_9CHLO|nr:hypothetical protein CYMTET_16479 [Cymbomonas tetramitiformis]